MSVRRLMDDSEDEAQYRPYINTGGPLDIVNGKYIPKADGGWALSGGLGLTTAGIAKANKFKSTLINGALINGLARFPESELYLYDSEEALDKKRLIGFSSLHVHDEAKRQEHLDDLDTRVRLYNTQSSRGESLDAWFDFMKELRDKKVKDAKNWEVETELFDPMTGKPYRMLLPTFIGIDSWTEAPVAQLNIRNEEITADTEMSKQRTIFMEEGLKKGMLMRQLPRICAQGGFALGMTGHLGTKVSMDGKPLAKDMAFMKQDETVKSMGNKFYFLMSSIFKIDNTKVLNGKNDPNESEYPMGDDISATELQELMVSLPRTKNVNSGTQVQLVSSQRFGVMYGLSYYNFLRNNKYFGMGSPTKVRNPFLGDRDIGRTKIFKASTTSYEVERALELTYQLFMIQSTWTLMGQPVDYSISVEEFVDKLQKSSYAVDDILNSRGWWTYTDAKVDRPYLTLPDILSMLDGTYQPKLFAVTK
jgi:hypothetical protein